MRFKNPLDYPVGTPKRFLKVTDIRELFRCSPSGATTEATARRGCALVKACESKFPWTTWR